MTEGMTISSFQAVEPLVVASLAADPDTGQ
jgi:hypothetical protein